MREVLLQVPRTATCVFHHSKGSRGKEQDSSCTNNPLALCAHRFTHLHTNPRHFTRESAFSTVLRKAKPGEEGKVKKAKPGEGWENRFRTFNLPLQRVFTLYVSPPAFHFSHTPTRTRVFHGSGKSHAR